MENVQVNFSKPKDDELMELRASLSRLRYAVQDAEKEKADFDRVHEFINANTFCGEDYDVRLRELTNVRLSQRAYDRLDAFIIRVCNERYAREMEEQKC